MGWVAWLLAAAVGTALLTAAFTAGAVTIIRVHQSSLPLRRTARDDRVELDAHTVVAVAHRVRTRWGAANAAQRAELWDLLHGRIRDLETSLNTQTDLATPTRPDGREPAPQQPQPA